MAIKTLKEIVNENNINMNKKYTTQQLQDITWTNKQKKNLLARYQEPEKQNVVVRSMATVDNAVLNMIKGFLNTTEGIADTISYLEADVVDFFGADEYADKKRKVIKKDLTSKLFENDIVDAIEGQAYNSKANQVANQLFYGAGNVMAMAGGVSALGGAGFTPTASSLMTSFSSAYGNATSEALRNGDDLKTARKKGIINGTAEAISEQMFDALPGMKVYGWGDKAVGKAGSFVQKYFGTRAGKVAMRVLENSGEGFEEIMSNVLTSTFNDLAYLTDKKNFKLENPFKQLYSKDSWEQFLYASLTSAFTNGANTFVTTQQKNSILKAYAKDNGITFGEAKNQFNKAVQEKAEVQKSTMSGTNLKQETELEDENKIKTLKEIMEGTFVEPGTETQTYQYKTTDNELVNAMNQSIVDSNGSNDYKTRSAAELATKIIEDLNVPVVFTNNEQLQSQMSEQQLKETQGRTINGFVDDNGKMYLNLDSDELASFTVGHETKHFFESNKDMNDVLNKALKDYAVEKGVYDTDLKEITALYTDKNGNLFADPETELMADYVGKFFTDEEFVRNLSTKNPSLFQRIKDYFEKLYLRVTNQKEKLLVKQIKDTINKAYRQYAEMTGGKVAATEERLFNETVEQKKARQRGQTKQQAKQKAVLPDARNVDKKKENVLPIKEKTQEKPEVKKETKKVEIKKVEKKEKYSLSKVQGLENRSKEEINQISKKFIEEKLNENGIDNVDIKGIDIHGSRNRGTAKAGSDLDVVVEYDGDMREDDLFNILNEEPLYIDGIKVDINPITASDTGTLEEYMKRSNEYDQEKIMSEAKEKYGTTNNFEYGAFMTTDGELLDFQNGNQRNEHEDFKINNIDANEFVEMGAIRIAPESNGIQIEAKPTAEQYNKLYDLIEYLKDNEFDENIYMDIDHHGVIFDLNTPTSKIINNIKNYWNEGTIPTSNNMKYSISKDSKGNDLTKAQQEYFKNSKVVDKNGNLEVMYHGTPYGGFNEFTPVYMGSKDQGGYFGYGYYFTNDKQVASFYADEDFISEDERTTEPGQYGNVEIKEVYLNVTNPYYVNGSEVEYEQGALEKLLNTNNSYESTSKLKSMGYDGVIYENEDGGKEITIFDSNQAKNVTNTNPSKSEDLRYSLSVKEANTGVDSDGEKLTEGQIKYFGNSKVTDSEGNLQVVYHGTQNYDFNEFEGGVFLTDDYMNADGYAGGERIIAAYVNMENPLVLECEGRKWDNLDTPYGTSTREIVASFDRNKYDGVIFENINDNWIDDEEYGYPGNVYYVDNSNQVKNIDNENPTTSDDIRYSLSPKGEMVDNETGEKVELETSEVGTTGTLMAIHNLSEDKMKGILELGGFPVPSIAITNPEKVNHKGFGEISVLFDKSTIDPAIKENEVYDRDVWSPRFPHIDREINDSKIDQVAEEIGISDSSLQSIAEEYNSVENLSYRLSRDSDIVEKFLNDNKIKFTNEDNIYKLAEENNIQEYLKNKLDGVYGKKGIYNNKSYITDNGNRRSFWQMHDEYNLENIVKNLKSQNTVSSETTMLGAGFGNLQANMSNKLKSIEDIKNKETNIMTSEEANVESQKIVDELNQESAELAKLYGENYDPFWDSDSINYQLQEFSKLKKLTKEGFYEIANKYNPQLAKADEKLVNNIIKTMDKLKNIPTDYFEAKPQRAVGLNEVQQAIIPNNLDDEFKKQLQDAGIEYTEYDPSVEGDRQRVINQFDDLKFSLSREGETRSEKYDDFYKPKVESKIRLSDLKKKEIEMPIAKKKTATTSQKGAKSIPLIKDKDVIRVEINNIAKQINEKGDFDIKSRGWLDSIRNSQAIEDKGFLRGLNLDKASYQVQTNQKSVDTANEYIKRNGYDKSVSHAQDIIKSGKTPTASDVALLQRMTQEAIKNKDYATAQDLIMDTAVLGTDLGQAVQALSIIKKLTPEGQLKLYTKIVDRAKLRGEKSFKDVEITPDMVEKVLGAYNEDGTYDQNDLNARVEEFKQDIANQMKATVGDKVNAWRYLAMLGNPKTHIRNVVSNVAMKGTIKVKNAMARTLESVLPVKDRTKTWKKASNEIKDFAKNTAVEMKDIITGENKYNEKYALENEKQIFKTKALEKISNFNTNALETEDWLFSRSAFESTFREYLTANGINTKEDIENNPEVVEKGKIYAVEQAEIATFRQYSKLAAAISRLERNNKAAKYAVNAVLPFKKTPINVAKAGFNYSPLGLIKNMSYDLYQLKQGNINASQFIDNISQGLTGTSLALLGYGLAKAGILSGSGDDDKEDKYENQLGKQNYAINVGGKSYSISWLSPVAMPMLVGANAYEKLEEGEDWNADIIMDTLAQTLDPLSEMSFVSGLTDTLKSYNTGSTQMIKNMAETGAQSYILQFFPTIMSQFASTVDDKKRSTKVSNNSPFKFGEETLRKIMLKIPGLRNQLEVQTDIWGNEKEQSENIVTRAFESFLAPYSKTENTTSKLDKEILRIYNKTGENSVIPGIPYAYVKKDSETYRMSASEYTKYKETFGQTANNTLTELVNSDSYKQVSDEDKVKMIENVYKYAREQAKQQYFDSIKEQYSSKKLSKIEQLEDTYGISAADYYGNVAEYNYASKNPERYLAVKAIGDYDTYQDYKEQIKYIKDTYKGSENTNRRKQAVYDYINSLPLSIEQKLILQKIGGGYSVKNQANRLRNYINSLDLSVEDKQAIDKVLFK